MDIGKKIEQARKAKGLTLEELGRLVGTGKSTVLKWENGTVKGISQEYIPRLAEALDVSVNYLLGEDVRDGDEELLDLPDVRMLARAGKKLTPEQRETAIRMMRFLFPEAFEDEE